MTERIHGAHICGARNFQLTLLQAHDNKDFLIECRRCKETLHRSKKVPINEKFLRELEVGHVCRAGQVWGLESEEMRALKDKTTNAEDGR